MRGNTPDNDPKGHYGALGLPAGASVERVAAAFRAQAKRLHPDLCADAGAAARFRRARQAFEYLSDPHLKASYDAQGHAARSRRALVPITGSGCPVRVTDQHPSRTTRPLPYPSTHRPPRRGLLIDLIV